jgi:hypothetical protein
MLALIAVNPYGLAYFQYLIRALMMPRLVSEWHPIWTNLSLPQIVILLFSLVLAIYPIAKIGIHNVDGFPALFIFALASIFCRRLIFFYAIVWSIYVPGYLQRTALNRLIHNLLGERAKLMSIILGVITVVICLRIISLHPWKLLVPTTRLEESDNHPVYPEGPVEYLAKEAFNGNIMTFFHSGSYVIWKLYPRVHVSMDSRYEAVYQEWQLIENINFYRAEKGWENILLKYPTDLLLVEKEFPLAKEMDRKNSWKKIYTDKVFELYARPGLILPIEDKTGSALIGKFP